MGILSTPQLEERSGDDGLNLSDAWLRKSTTTRSSSALLQEDHTSTTPAHDAMASHGKFWKKKGGQVGE
jgi:hypothetical protein